MLQCSNKKPDAPLFQTKDGKRLYPRNILTRFKAIGEDIGCGWVNLHSMRHTYASRLFKNKVDIKVKVSSMVTRMYQQLKIYVHFIDNIIEDSVQVLDSITAEKLPTKEPKKKDNIRELKKVSTH